VWDANAHVQDLKKLRTFHQLDEPEVNKSKRGGILMGDLEYLENQ
jgi:hypothetical protein